MYFNGLYFEIEAIFAKYNIEPNKQLEVWTDLSKVAKRKCHDTKPPIDC